MQLFCAVFSHGYFISIVIAGNTEDVSAEGDELAVLAV